MNKALYFAACLTTLLAVASAQSLSPNIGNATTTTERINYGDRAAQQLRALRSDIEAVYRNTPLAGQSQLAPYLSAVSAAEDALAEMKTAGQTEFSARRADFEKAFARADRMWSDYRGSTSNNSGTQTESPSLNINGGY